MKVLQTSNVWGLNCNTWESMNISGLPLERDSVVLVPRFLWNFYSDVLEESKLRLKDCDFVQAKTFSIKELTIELASTCDLATISFLNNGVREQIKVLISERKSNWAGAYDEILFNFKSENDGVLPSYFRRTKLRGNYTMIADLHLNSNCILSYGLSPNQMQVMYKHRVLGTSYVFMCGTWGILLDDELNFDSLVIIYHNTRSSIRVAKFVYTVNPYVIKCILMLR